jgi:hypothetical protein
MKSQWILTASLILLVLTGMVGCASEAPLVAENIPAVLSPQVQITRQAIGEEPKETQPAMITPTQAITEKETVNETQVQTPPGNESTGSGVLARQDLAKRLGISMDSIKVSAVIGQEFSTEAFYCQVSKERIAKDESPTIISGFSILLNANGRRYEYHASGQTVVFCRSLS